MEKIDPPKEPVDLAEWLWYVKRYEDSIFVRELVDDRWETVALSSLGPREWGNHLAKWLEGGHLPVRILEPHEQEEMKNANTMETFGQVETKDQP